jgi:hypothetical protein
VSKPRKLSRKRIVTSATIRIALIIEAYPSIQWVTCSNWTCLFLIVNWEHSVPYNIVWNTKLWCWSVLGS